MVALFRAGGGEKTFDGYWAPAGLFSLLTQMACAGLLDCVAEDERFVTYRLTLSASTSAM